MSRRRRWARRLGLSGSLIAAGAAGALRYDAGTDAATAPLLVIAVFLCLTALAGGLLLLIYAILKSTRMTGNLVDVINAFRAKSD